MGNVETATKFSGLKSISSIEDNYTEVNTKVFYIKAVLKISQYSQENNCVGVSV